MAGTSTGYALVCVVFAVLYIGIGLLAVVRAALTRKTRSVSNSRTWLVLVLAFVATRVVLLLFVASSQAQPMWLVLLSRASLVLWFAVFAHLVTQWWDMPNPPRSRASLSLWRLYAVITVVFAVVVVVFSVLAYARGLSGAAHRACSELPVLALTVAELLLIIGLAYSAAKITSGVHAMPAAARLEVTRTLTMLLAVFGLVMALFIMRWVVTLVAVVNSLTTSHSVKMLANYCGLHRVYCGLLISWIPECVALVAVLLLQWSRVPSLKRRAGKSSAVLNSISSAITTILHATDGLTAPLLAARSPAHDGTYSLFDGNPESPELPPFVVPSLRPSGRAAPSPRAGHRSRLSIVSPVSAPTVEFRSSDTVTDLVKDDAANVLQLCFQVSVRGARAPPAAKACCVTMESSETDDPATCCYEMCCRSEVTPLMRSSTDGSCCAVGGDPPLTGSSGPASGATAGVAAAGAGLSVLPPLSSPPVPRGSSNPLGGRSASTSSQRAKTLSRSPRLTAAAPAAPPSCATFRLLFRYELPIVSARGAVGTPGGRVAPKPGAAGAAPPLPPLPSDGVAEDGERQGVVELPPSAAQHDTAAVPQASSLHPPSMLSRAGAVSPLVPAMPSPAADGAVSSPAASNVLFIAGNGVADHHMKFHLFLAGDVNAAEQTPLSCLVQDAPGAEASHLAWFGSASASLSTLLSADTPTVVLPVTDASGAPVAELRCSLRAIKRGLAEIGLAAADAAGPSTAMTRTHGGRVSRWYSLPHCSNYELLVEEDLRESNYVFDVPRKLLRLLIEEKRAKLSSLRRMLARLPTEGAATTHADMEAGDMDTILELSMSGYSSIPGTPVRSDGRPTILRSDSVESADLSTTSGSVKAFSRARAGSEGAEPDSAPMVATLGDLETYLREAEAMKISQKLLNKRITELQAYIQHLASFSTLGAGGRGPGGVSFKRSTLKASKELQFLATNLHVQEMRVRRFPRQEARVSASALASLQAHQHTLAVEHTMQVWTPLALRGLHPTLGAEWNVGSDHTPTRTAGSSPTRELHNVGIMSGILDDNHHPEFVYDTVTVGAFAAHVYKFGHGGLRQMMQQLQAMNAARPLGAAVDVASQIAQSELLFEIEKRSDVVLCQAVTTLVTAFARKLRLIQRYMSLEAGRRLLLQYSRVGFLIGFESLLSTAGSEFGMLGDYEKGARMLSRFSFRLLPPRKGVRASLATPPVEPSGAPPRDRRRRRRNSAAIGWGPRYNCADWALGGGVEILRQSDNTYVIEMRLWPMDDDDASGGTGGSGSGGAAGAGAGASANAGAGAGADPGSAASAQSTAQQSTDDAFGAALHALVPAELIAGRLIRVFPVIFTQGVNERQTMANMNFLMRAPSLQNAINRESLADLFTYYTLYKRHYQAQTMEMATKVAAWEDPDSDVRMSPEAVAVAKQELQRQRDKLRNLEDLLREVEQTIRLSNRSKALSILRLTSKFVRAVHGSRVTSCKSAKDRTAMSVTLEQAQLLVDFHGLDPSQLLAVADLMRRHGVRRANTLKNVGRASYAFNNLQQFFLPPEFRPPSGTGSSSVRS